VVAELHCTLADVDAARDGLAQALGREVEESISPQEAEQRFAVWVKLIYKALDAGHLQGRTRAGEWRLRPSDVGAWLRQREEMARDREERAALAQEREAAKGSGNAA
jgi:hypothetical protein